MAQKKSSSRTRNFACVVYPESAPENWLSILADTKVPCFVSPLHDRDFNPTGEPKKPHFHVLFCFEGVKSVEQVTSIFESFCGVGCEVVNSARAYGRYLCHLDNPEKHQYPTNQVKSFGGADYIFLIGTSSDKIKAIHEMLDFINKNHVQYFSQLVDYARLNNPEWFDTLIHTGSYFIKEYVKSKCRYWNENCDRH